MLGLSCSWLVRTISVALESWSPSWWHSGVFPSCSCVLEVEMIQVCRPRSGIPNRCITDVGAVSSGCCPCAVVFTLNLICGTFSSQSLIRARLLPGYRHALAFCWLVSASCNQSCYEPMGTENAHVEPGQGKWGLWVGSNLSFVSSVSSDHF